MAYGIRLRVSGDYACFTRPEMKVERVSYDVMTPSAARGILEAIHWKPAIRWVVDAIHVLAPIRFQSIRRNEVGHKASASNIRAAMKRESLDGLHLLVDEDRQQRAATVLVKPDYLIEAHFEMTDRAGPDDNDGKHLDIFNRRVDRGQCFHQPCLGTREFAAAFEPVPRDAATPQAAPADRTADLGFIIPRDLGFMLWDIDHANPGRPSLFFRAILTDGVLKIPAPDFAGDPPMTILEALAKAYDRLPDIAPPGYSAEKIGFLISLNDDGTVAGEPSDLRVPQGKKLVPRVMLVPQPMKRTAGIAPNFLWDKTSYVLGVTAGEGKRTADEHDAFVARHAESLAGNGDPGLMALLAFLAWWTPEMFETLGWPSAMQDENVVFALESDRLRRLYLHDRPEAKELWARLSAAGDKAQAICLVTGNTAPVARLHPAIKGVWGAQSSGASIVSFNLDAFASYGHEQGANAPVSEAAAFAYTTALNHFLAAGSKNRIQIADASIVFWANASDADASDAGAVAEGAFAAIFGGVGIDEGVQATRIGALLNQMRQGKPLRDFDPHLAHGVRFYVLGLAPNAARISIRFWFEDDFGVIAERYQRFVADMRIEPPPKDLYPPLWRYLVETAVLGKRENVPPNLAGEWMRSILAGRRYPLTLLATVLMRIRADHGVDALRVGMLKAILIRNFNREVPVALDPDNKDKGYLLGRLFALYEYIQTAALGSRVNATIRDKFYGAASAQPRKVFPLLDRGSANHLSKVGKESPGRKINLDRQLGQIMDLMAPAADPFPASLTAEEQALFALGYFHQRSDFYKARRDALLEGAGN